jgi:hypothetical protein
MMTMNSVGEGLQVSIGKLLAAGGIPNSRETQAGDT